MPLQLAFITVVLIWSTTPLAIKWSALGAGFSFAVFARMALGALLCALLLLVLRVRLPLHRQALSAYLVGGLSMFGAMALTYWSAQYINSGMISVLFGLSPLVTSLGAAIWLKEEAITPSKMAGMVLGVLGLALVFQGGLSVGNGAAVGLIALVAAVVLQSAGLVWLKRIGDDSPPLATTLGSLVVALPFFCVFWWIVDGRWPANLPLRALEATVYLGVVGSVFGFALYYYLIKHLDAGRVALIALITPVLAMLLGHGLDGETIQPSVWVGAASILLGLATHRWGADWLAFLTLRR